ncbi:MAG: M20/M25/M40 family metallo-hydrolase [Clostridia bacterium]|nr:M20/M25/M40 family metallo-hydrolase [Clostridia bacterium]
MNVHEFVKRNKEGLLDLLKELCAIPAPSGMEQARAAYCKAWLEQAGAKGVYTDGAQNVIFPFNCENSRSITVFVAHTDTVFPDTEPMPYADDGVRIHAPGVGDDTASLAVLLYVAKYFIENGAEALDGVMFVCNSCEEGLGNLRGTKELFRNFEGRIGRFISFDSDLSTIVDRCVGSHRYRVRIQTEGGHSFNSFGNRNAIAELAKLIGQIYEIKVPQKEGTKTTYNVGVAEGGTSVNTVAQSASMLCEYRSDDSECLEIMRQAFWKIFDGAKAQGTDIHVEIIGERPCMGAVDACEIEKMTKICEEILKQTAHMTVQKHSGSTDCNVPLSLGIPALCVGVYRGGGAHTREEWVEKASLPVGLEAGIRIAEALLKA